MEEPETKIEVGAWTAERLGGLMAITLGLTHLWMMIISFGAAGTCFYAVAAHLTIILLFLLVFLGRVPVRPGAIIGIADAILGVLVSAGGLIMMGGIMTGIALVLFLAGGLLAASAFHKLPPHERW